MSVSAWLYVINDPHKGLVSGPKLYPNYNDCVEDCKEDVLARVYDGHCDGVIVGVTDDWRTRPVATVYVVDGELDVVAA